MTQSCDVAVIGGGPAGSTAARMLVEKGWKVCLFEKTRHPRFHIGESLLPMNLPIFEQIGVLDEVKKIGVFKPGAEFYDPDPRREPHRFYFRDSLDKNYPHAYQVRRSELDELLLRNAEEAGVDVREDTRVKAVSFAADNSATLQVQPREGEPEEWQARFVVDASGRDTLLANQLGIKHKDMRHASAAVFGHFRNVPRYEGEDGGLISISWFEHGWIWIIPLADGVTSIGAVCDPEYLRSRDCSPEEFLKKTLALAPPHVHARFADMETVGNVQATGNYSYSAGEMVFPGAILVGDAWAFVDPVFSSGVLMGMRGALYGTRYVDAVLRGDAQEAEQRRAEFERINRRSVSVFRWMIARFNSPALRHLFRNPHNPLRVQEAVTSMLAGDVDRRNGVFPRLVFFRIVYYFHTLRLLPYTLAELRRRKRRAQTAFVGGTTEVDQA